MDEEERRRRALETGRELLENYKSKYSNRRLSKSFQQTSDEESFRLETENQSLDLRNTSNNGSIVSRDSISMSEGEGDGDLEGLAGRVNKLREELQDKESEAEALNVEFDHLRAEASSPTSSHSQNSNLSYKDVIVTYHAKLQEFEQAVNRRDNLIEDLTNSLQQALAARDTLLTHISVLNSTKLGSSNEEITSDSKISALENALGSQKELVSELESKLEQAQQNVKKLELEKETQNTELNDYKNVIENLNKKIQSDSVGNNSNTSETQELQKQYEEQVEKIKKDMKVILDKFADETNANNIKHDTEIKELMAKHESEIQKLKDENQNLEIRHAKEMSVLQTQLNKYKHAIDDLKLNLVTQKNSFIEEKELLSEQIKLHKLQYDALSSKLLAATSVLESKESIERSLQQALDDATTLRTENEVLKFKLDDLDSRYSAAQSLIENGQLHERTLSNKIFTLQKSLSRLSGFSFSELDETAYQTLDEMALQFEIAKQQLDDKAEMESQLVQKIQCLEDLVSKTTKELESANLAKESYEKQIKDMKNTCDRMKSEINANLDQQQEHYPEQQQRFSSDSLDGMRNPSSEFEQKILELKKTIAKRDEEMSEYIRKLKELTEINNKLVEESDKLKNGLSKAYAQCALFEEKLDQTLGFGDTKLDDSTLMLDQTVSSDGSFDLEELLHKQSNYNKVLMKLDTCRKQLEDYEQERVQLLQNIEDLTKEKNEVLDKVRTKEEQYQDEIKNLKLEIATESQKFQQQLSNFEENDVNLKKLKTEMEEKHAKEMEELRTYFEQKCLQMEKQYSEEIFSQQSKKMSDNDSELEELTEDLYVGGGTVECLSTTGENPDVLEKNNRDKVTLNVNRDDQIILEERIAKITAEYEEKLETMRQQLQEVKEKTGRTLLLKAVNQALLTVKSESDENWPTELLELRNKFTSNTKRDVQAVKERYLQEIIRLKENHSQIVNDLHEEIDRIKTESHESLQSNLIKERDTLHKTCLTLKGLVVQLINYFANCEEELNNTLISEVVKKQLMTRSDEQNPKVKRVHFAPQSSEIASIVSDSDLHDLINSDKDIIKILKTDLDACLQRLKTESAIILNESISDTESWSTGDNPSDKLIEIEKLLATYQEENEHLKVKVIDLQQRLLIAENKKEIITEGYGEQNESVCEESTEDFSQLQDRAKYVVMNGSNDTTYLLQLIDELCRYADKNIDDIKREKEDLQHQVSLVPTPPPNIQRVSSAKIEAADKQLRSTRKFQEEQAVEREAERDEAARQIQHLQDRLREREREKDRDYRITSAEQSALSPASSSTGNSTLRQIDDSVIDVSVEALTIQMRELETKKAEAETELKDATSKIYDLRECIHDLEQQLQSRSEREELLNEQIEQLKEVIVAQTKNQQELAQELDVIKSGNENNQLSDHIDHLQEELRRHQMNSEQLTANSSALKQLRTEIHELQSQLDRKTRELEALHVCGSSLSLSQPSEDVSIREQIDAARCASPDDPSSPPTLPLDHVLKLKDTLLKHFRAEDVALKRLKDLDIQLSSLQRQNEELLAEQEILQQTTSEQLFQIETLRARLEQQKHNAPFVQRQATSRLESQLYEINDRLQIAEHALTDKNIELTEVKDQLERVSRILAEKENEIANVVQSENDVMQKLKDKIEILEEENRLMKAGNLQTKGQSNLPQIIDSMLADKNEEIDHLREQLMKREKQLEVYLSLDETQLRELIRQNEQQKNSARTLSDILSINSECEDMSEAIREAPNSTRIQNVTNFKIGNSAHLLSKRDVVDFSQPITETPKGSRLDIESHSEELISSNVIEISKEMESIPMKSHEKVPLVRISQSPGTDVETPEDSMTCEDQNGFLCPRHGKVSNVFSKGDNETITEQRIQELEINLSEVKEELKAKSEALDQRDAELMEIQSNLQQLHANIESLNEDRLFYKLEYEKVKENEEKIQKDLSEVENILKRKTEELIEFKEKIQLFNHSETIILEKQNEIENLKEIISKKDITIETIQAHNIEMDNQLKDLLEYRQKRDVHQKEISEYQNEIKRLNEGLNNRDQMIRRLEEMARRSSLSGGSSPSDKDQEIFHLQEYLKEKDKVIRQMNDDGKSLHRALETIQNKMKESGNVVELRRLLKEERKINVELSEKIAKLQTEVEMLSCSKRPEEDNDIAEKVQRELNLSARLDQQLLNVIDSDQDNVLSKCKDLKQANKEIDELNKIKDDLEIESEMLKSQIIEYENRIMQLKTDAEEASKKVIKLEKDLAREKNLLKSTQLQLQREKSMVEEIKINDMELISQLRIKLKEALELKDRLLMDQKNYEHLKSVKGQNVDSTSENELKKQQLVLLEELESEKQNLKDAYGIRKQLETEKERLEKLYEVAQLKVDKLTSDLELADCDKDQLKSDLRRAKEELKAKTKENEWQKSILKTMTDAENKRNQQKTDEHSELKNLRRELKNTQEVMLDFEMDMKNLKLQLEEAAEREAQLTRCIESLTDKETELTDQLSVAKSEDKKLREIIVDQQNELKLYLQREIALTEELKREKLSPNKNNSPSKILERVKDLNATIARLTEDKLNLYENIARTRKENERYMDHIRLLESQIAQKNKGYQSTVNRNDSDERLQHFYGRYLRSDSRRKSLAYQKHYLLCIIAGYQRVEENTLAFLAQLTKPQRNYVCQGPRRRKSLAKFRSIVLLVISIQRMKWMVLRWRTGRRVGANVVLGNIDRPVPTRPYVNQTNEHSPPVKERSLTNGTSRFSSEPYFRRFTDIQQTLHLRVPESSTDLKSD